MGNEATNVYLARTLGLTQLKILPIAENSRQSIHMAVHKDLVILASVLQKALDSITESEYAQIFNHWIRYETKVDYRHLMQTGLSFLGLFALIWVISLFWIVRLKKAIKQKEAAQKRAEQADREKSRYLARISHEIRTPLHGISAMGYLLKKTNLDLTQKRYVQTICTASKTMGYIINDILEFSRLDEDRITLEQVPFVLDDVLQNCISIESYLVKQKGLALELRIDEELPQYLLGDPTRLIQILINLINNAVKFTDQGSVEIAVQAQQINEQNYRFSFIISDTGIGMDQEQMKGLFIPFMQANESIHRKYGGSGLGLSIVKRLVEKMSGSIEVASTVHKGSTFTVQLPFALDLGGMEKERQRQKTIDFSDLKALLVITDKTLTQRIELLFKTYQISFDGVSSPSLAASVLKDSVDYDLIIFELETKSESETDLAPVLMNTRAKVIALIHELDQQEEQRNYDLVLPLPLINSVLLNALLQLFGPEPGKSIETTQETAIVHTLPLMVLVVEDNPTNQAIAKEVLQRAGFSILTANDGQQGFALFCEKETSIDIVLMDLHMDVMDGYESSTLIRQRNKEVPILVTSADIFDTVKARCKEIGVNDIISKPYNPDVLIEKINFYGSPYYKQKHKDRLIDTKLGIRQVGGDPTVYKLLLSSFAKETRLLLDDLEDAVQAHNRSAISELVHRCKGSCGAIGASKAYKLSIAVQGNLEDMNLIAQLQSTLTQTVIEAEKQETAEQS
ncbi:MAG: response regulator [Spirochaetia bacterium]|nr:response regulator [Spirochaetia bacterium]